MPNQRAPGVTPRTVAFPDELWERAAEVARMLEVSTGAIVRTALVDYLTKNGA